MTLLSIVLVPIMFLNALQLSSRAATSVAVAVQQTMPGGSFLYLSEDLHRVLRRQLLIDETKLVSILEREGIDATSRPSKDAIIEHWREHGEHSFLRSTARILARAEDWSGDAARDVYLRAGGVLVGLLLLATLLMKFGSIYATLAGGSWIPAWLATFPVASHSLVVARALDYSLVQVMPWFLIFPITFQMARVAGSPHALWIGLMATLMGHFLTGTLRLYIETWLRMRCSLQRLRTLQGLSAVLAIAVLGVVMAIGMPAVAPFFFVDFARNLSDLLFFVPGPSTLALGRPMHFVVGGALALLVCAASIAGTVGLLRQGSMQSSGVDPSRMRATSRWRAAAGRRLGILGRDWLGVLRDRQVFAQVVVIPAFLVAMNFVTLSFVSQKPAAAAISAYFLAFYCALTPCSQVLASEGRALWILYTLPQELGVVVRRKLLLWCALAVAVGLVPIATSYLRGEGTSLAALASDVFFVSFGAVAVCFLTASVSILATEVSSDGLRSKPSARVMFLVFSLASIYIAALGQQAIASRIQCAVVFGTLAYALWQRAAERVDMLLDPLRKLRAGITLVDGAAALLVFLVLHLLFTLVFARGSTKFGLTDVNIGFLASAVVTTLVLAIAVASRGASLRTSFALAWDERCSRTWALSAVPIAIVAAFVATWLQKSLLDPPSLETVASSDGYLLLILVAVVAAPVVEELLFRGLVYRGLTRSLRPGFAAIWSALLFAVMHPLPAWPAIFVLGYLLALVYERSRWLPAAMLLHAVYNATVLALAT